MFPNYFKYSPNSPGFGRDLLRLKSVGVRWFGNLSIPSVFSIHRRTRRRKKKYIETPSCLLYPPDNSNTPPIPSSPPLLSHCNCTVQSTGTCLPLASCLLPLVSKSSFLHLRPKRLAFVLLFPYNVFPSKPTVLPKTQAQRKHSSRLPETSPPGRLLRASLHRSHRCPALLDVCERTSVCLWHRYTRIQAILCGVRRHGHQLQL